MYRCHCNYCTYPWLWEWKYSTRRQDPPEYPKAAPSNNTQPGTDSNNGGADANTNDATGLPDTNGGVPRMSSVEKRSRTKYVLRLTAEQQQRAAEIIKKKIENPLMKCWISSESFWKDVAELKALLGIVEEK